MGRHPCLISQRPAFSRRRPKLANKVGWEMARVTRAELEALRDAAAAAKAEASAALAEAKTALSAAQRFARTVEEKAADAIAKSSEIQTAAEEAKEEAEALSGIHGEIQPKAKEIQEFAVVVENLKKEIGERKAEIKLAKEAAIDLHKTVEKALPGATSAGLASAFETRKKSYRTPKLLWSAIFVVSTVSLACLAIWNPLGSNETIGTAEDFLVHLLARLPFAAPLVWLGIYASARHGQALRLEEEYAHKEAISRSFEGYKKQLLELESESEEIKGTIELVNQVIAALALHPGRVYDGAQPPLSPLDAVLAKLDQVIAVLAKRVDPLGPTPD